MNKLGIKISLFLLLLSFNLLSLAVVYYEFEDDVVNYRYSDKNEFKSIQEGLNFLNKLPIQFNITNKYFSNFDNLDDNVREEIIMAYAIKNDINIYNCDGLYKCINNDDLKDIGLLNTFNTKTKFESNRISIYVDDYGSNVINKSDLIDGYMFKLDKDDNKNYRKFTYFSHYKEVDDMFVFFVYEGYYKGNCSLDEEIELFDFMTGESVYKDVCNSSGTFNTIPEDVLSKLQLYKYELKKNKDGDFYLYGYNPVKK